MRLKIKFHPYYLMTGVYVLVSMILGMILSDGLVIFLGWNIILATLVFVMSKIIHNQYQNNGKKVYLIILCGIYVLLFPNTIYVLTDFIHFQNYHFFIDYPNTYALQVSDWLVYGHIVIGALYATKLGVTSLENINILFKLYHIKFYYLGLSFLFLLSSLGIYIGRFLRFNSWNVLKFFDILKEVFSQGIFMLYFVLIFFVIHWASYFLLKEYYKKT